MTDQSLPFLPATPARRWRVNLTDDQMRTVDAVTFRVEHGALVLILPAGSAAAYAPGRWRSIEPEAAT